MSIFFFKQKTAYEMRISDWSSDVCSSDLWSIRGPEGNPDARARRTEIVAVAAGIGAEKFELERAGVVPGGLRRGGEDRPGCGGRRAHEYGGRPPRRIDTGVLPSPVFAHLPASQLTAFLFISLYFILT